MSSKNIKLKTIKKSLNDADSEKIGAMFTSMMGESEPEMKIAAPKYDRMVKHINSALVCLSIISKIKGVDSDDAKHIRNFVDAVLADEGALLTYHVDEIYWKVGGSLFSDEARTKFIEVFKELKKCRTARSLLITCDNIAPYRVKLRESDIWIGDVGVNTFYPFPFARGFDLKDFYLNADPSDKELMTKMVRKIFESSYELYRDVTAPDIDIDEFTEVITSSIQSLKSVPELSRCDKAFSLVGDSIGMFKDRFDGYYQDFVSTKDPTIMMQHFILDVAKEQSSGDPEMTQQFRRILAYYKKTVGEKKLRNPQLNTVLTKIDAHMDTLDNLNNLN